MAAHLESFVTANIPKVSWGEFFESMLPWDLCFCWGSALVSKAIEDFTNGPSHVLKVWLPPRTGPWLTLEAEFTHGVRIGPFADYLRYPGNVVLCRRPITFEQGSAELEFGSTLLDYKYDTIEFASLVARHFSTRFPLIQPRNELYCSGLQQALAAKSIPFLCSDKPWATPEQLYTDPSVTALMYVEGKPE